MTDKKKEEVKNKSRRTKLELDLLKNFVFEKSALGYTQKQIANETGYTEQYICKLSKEIREEYILELKEDKNKHIADQIIRLEGVLKKINKLLDKEEKNAYVVQKLVAEYRGILEQMAKLRGLLVQKHEVVSDVADNLIEKFNIIKE